MFENSNYELWHGDCLELMDNIPDKSIDCIITDLPYGITRCKWDVVIPFEPLWKQYGRVIKDNGAILLFSIQPFTSALVMSNIRMYRYEWIWQKKHPKGHLNAKKMPMRAHENIEVFYKKLPVYNPQMTHGHKRRVAKTNYTREADGSSCYGREVRNTLYDSTDRYPLDIQAFSNANYSGKIHNTQKPVEIYEYFMKTYTNENETVLDSAAGSMTCAIAAINTCRKVICIEKDKEIFKTGRDRVMEYLVKRGEENGITDKRKI